MTDPVNVEHMPSGEELTAPHLPEDAKRMGLTPLTGADLNLVSSLRSDRPLHKWIAWVLLAGLVVVIALLVVLAH